MSNIGSIMMNNRDYIKAEQCFSQAISNQLNSAVSFWNEIATLRQREASNEVTNNMFILACRYFQKAMSMMH